jgi:phosphatidylinositol dimannoside acyltransferase
MNSTPRAPRREQSALLRRLAHFGALEGPLGLLRWGPRPIGFAFGLALPEMRRRIVRNLRRVHGTRGALREQLDVLGTLGNYAACFTEAMAAGRHDTRVRVSVSGEEHLPQALAQGGVVVATAHVGPWELTAQLLGTELQADVLVVMEAEPNAEAGRLQDAWRRERGLRVLHVGAHATDALPLLAHLKRGGVAALQLDRAPPSGRVLDVSLFGSAFAVPEGPFRLAGMSDAALVPVFARRTAFFEYELSIAEPIRLSRRADARELTAAAQRATDAMQAWIRRAPTQWFHFTER